jgi:hypothetical protein
MIFGCVRIVEQHGERLLAGDGIVYTTSFSILAISATLNYWLVFGGFSMFPQWHLGAWAVRRFIHSPDLFAYFVADVVISPMMLFAVGRLAGLEMSDIPVSILGTMQASILLGASAFKMHALYNNLILGVALSSVCILYWEIKDIVKLTETRVGRKGRARSQAAALAMVLALAGDILAAAMTATLPLADTRGLYVVAFVHSIGKYSFCKVALASPEAIALAEEWYFRKRSARCGTIASPP